MAAVCGSTKVGKKKVAAIVTEYRPGSHADVLLTKYLLYALNKSARLHSYSFILAVVTRFEGAARMD
jgi:hypothetical protein